MLEKVFPSDMPRLNKYIRENKNLAQIQLGQKMSVSNQRKTVSVIHLFLEGEVGTTLCSHSNFIL